MKFSGEVFMTLKNNDSVIKNCDFFGMMNSAIDKNFLKLVSELKFVNNKIYISEIDKFDLNSDERDLFLNYLDLCLNKEVVYDDVKFFEDATKQYLREINNIPLLSDDEFKILFDEYSKGSSDAEKKIVESNLRLVVWVSKRFVGLGMPILDLIHEGNFGLYKALKKYDINKGKFSNYAFWWIVQSINIALGNQSRNVRVSKGMFDNIARYKKFANNFLKNYGRYPSDEEIKEKLGVNDSGLKSMKMFLNDTCSLNAPISNDEDSVLGDYVADDSIEDFDEIVYKNMLNSVINEALDSLPPKRRNVIEKRFGLNGNSKMTLRAIGEEMGVSYESISVLEKRALKQLSTFSVIKRICSDYGGSSKRMSDRLIEKNRRAEVIDNISDLYCNGNVSTSEICIIAYIFGAFDVPKNVNSAMELGCLVGKSDDEKLDIINKAIFKYANYYRMQNMNNKKKLVRK